MSGSKETCSFWTLHHESLGLDTILFYVSSDFTPAAQRWSPSWHCQVRVEGGIPHIASIDTEMRKGPLLLLRVEGLLLLSTCGCCWHSGLSGNVTLDLHSSFSDVTLLERSRYVTLEIKSWLPLDFCYGTWLQFTFLCVYVRVCMPVPVCLHMCTGSHRCRYPEAKMGWVPLN